MKFDNWLFFENLPRKFNFYLYLTRITDTVHEDDYTFLIILPSVLLRMRNISDKVVEKFITHILISIFFFLGGGGGGGREKWCLYRVTWRNIVLPDRVQMTMRCMRFACWIAKAADKLIIYNTYCFLLQEWLDECTAMWRYAYVACLDWDVILCRIEL